MTTNGEATADHLTADLAALRHDVARLAETMGDIAQRQVQSASHRVSEAAGDARDRLASSATEVQARICAATRSLGRTVERNPMTAVMIALGVGMSLGLLSRVRG